MLQLSRHLALSFIPAGSAKTYPAFLFSATLRVMLASSRGLKSSHLASAQSSGHEGLTRSIRHTELYTVKSRAAAPKLPSSSGVGRQNSGRFLRNHTCVLLSMRGERISKSPERDFQAGLLLTKAARLAVACSWRKT